MVIFVLFVLFLGCCTGRRVLRRKLGRMRGMMLMRGLGIL